jgi:glycosyltransferase involved in cell wall biosynthesis
MKAELSVIVPVYNVENYLSRCINSIRSQTLKNFELILVDDGSFDGSGKICDEYCAKDERISVIHIPNGGPANARNTGIKAARGTYIGFVDSDDWIDADMYLSMTRKADATGADLVFCDYMVETASGSIPEEMNLYQKTLFDRKDIEKLFLPYFYGYLDPELKNYKRHCPFADFRSYNGLCIVRSELLMRNGIAFKSEKKYYNEDNLFNLSVVSAAEIIAHAEGCYYHYRFNDNSFTRTFNRRYLEAKLNKFDYLRTQITEKGLDDSYKRRLENKICIDAVGIIDYYAGAPSLKVKERRYWVKRVLEADQIKAALKKIKLTMLPASKLKIIMTLAKLHASRTIVAVASLYRAATGNRQQ